MAQLKTQTFEQLKNSKKYVSEISMQGFLINVSNSLRKKLITEKEKEYLLTNFLEIK